VRLPGKEPGITISTQSIEKDQITLAGEKQQSHKRGKDAGTSKPVQRTGSPANVSIDIT
jgi:hypothetical protein